MYRRAAILTTAIVFAVAIGLAILSPHPQLFQYLLLISGVFSLYLAFSQHAAVGRLPRDVAIRRLAYALGAVVLVLGLAGVVWLAVRTLPRLPTRVPDPAAVPADRRKRPTTRQSPTRGRFVAALRLTGWLIRNAPSASESATGSA